VNADGDIFGNGSITMFDENFNEIKKVNLGLSFGCTINKTGDIYVTDCKNNCIYKMDVELNMVKKEGSHGSGDFQFHSPLSICFENNFLYICDRLNERIQILNDNLEFVDKIKLQFEPKSIKIIDKTIGICSLNGTYFYKLDTKQLIKQYPKIVGKINKINSSFYVLSYKTSNKIYCFDHLGSLTEEISIKSLNQYFSDPCDGSIAVYKKNLIISSYSGSGIICSKDKF